MKQTVEHEVILAAINYVRMAARETAGSSKSSNELIVAATDVSFMMQINDDAHRKGIWTEFHTSVANILANKLPPKLQEESRKKRQRDNDTEDSIALLSFSDESNKKY
jgi:hypothetical protein